MLGHKAIKLIMTLLLTLSFGMTKTSDAKDKEPRIVFYATDHWDSWTQAPAIPRDRIEPPVKVGNTQYYDCKEMIKDLLGQPITYQLQTSNQDLMCPYFLIYGNIRQPSTRMFSERGIIKDIRNNLDINSLPWKFRRKNDLSHGFESIIGLTHTSYKSNSIDFTVDNNNYIISTEVLADHIGDGTQQVLAIFHHVWSDSKGALDAEEAHLLLVRDTPGGPIRVESPRFRPSAYELPPKALRRKAIVIDDRHQHH